MVLFLYAGKGLIYLGYGKEGMLAREKLGKSDKGLSYGFGIMSFIWLFFGVFFYFVFQGSKDSMFSLVLMILCPVLYGIWVIFARKSVPRLIEESISGEE